ncbi:MAG: hypothetical protein JWM16_5424 [Verrucomicrobiales bacterium]|nr:hypothetical protein [Verrucomicrobiales bacterium]
MSTSAETHPGLLGSVRRLVDTGLGLAQNRLELFVVEIQEEKIRFVELIILVCALVAVAILALTLLTLTVVLVFWENGRVPALVSLSVIYIGGAFWLLRMVRTRLHQASKPFSATLEELEKDKQWLHGN